MNRSFGRRDFIRAIGLGAGGLALHRWLTAGRAALAAGKKPNVILCMTDDQGWGDTGYNGHKVLKTPNLDAMSREGLRFDRWYSGAPVCSPTRGSCVTGRHPYRYGIFFANVGHMKKEEITLSEALKTQGYATGHFGKWHLGTLTTKVRDSNRGGRPGSEEHYSPPQENGFDVCFSTEAKVPTWNPMLRPGTTQPYGTHYWNERGEIVRDNLEGDDSRVIMDRVVPFVRKAVGEARPFLAVVWFHTPHLPVVAGPKYLAMYEGHRGAHYLGCITAMDEQVGRLRAELRRLGVAENTMLWFSSDNGPEGKRRTDRNGSAGPFRGRKRSLYEGGVRVPGLLVWPGKIKKPRVVKIPCCTSDYFPTVMDVLGENGVRNRLCEAPSGPSRQTVPDTVFPPEPVDGVSLLPLIEGKMTKRPRPIAFESAGQVTLSDNRYKIYTRGAGARKRGKGGVRPAAGPPKYELYDLTDDPGEKRDIAAEHPEIVERMKAVLDEWRASCERSLAGEDYG